MKHAVRRAQLRYVEQLIARVNRDLTAPVERARREDVGDAPSFLKADGDDWIVVNAESGDELERHAGPSPVAALNAAFAHDWFKAAAAKSEGGRKTYVPLVDANGDDVGKWRWVDASAQEDSEYTDEETKAGWAGTLITEAHIDEMVSNLAARLQPVQLDGVESGVHESATDSDAFAPGWAYVGIKVFDADGRAHLFLRIQVRDEVDAAMNRGALAWGSIAFWPNDVEPYTGEEIGASLISYALTNQPFVQGLMPHSAVRTRTVGELEVSLAFGRSRRTEMTTKRTKATAERGPAQDALTKIAEMLKIDTSSDEHTLAWAAYDAVCALTGAAKVEAITEGGGTPTENEAVAASVAARTDNPAGAASGKDTDMKNKTAVKSTDAATTEKRTAEQWKEALAALSDDEKKQVLAMLQEMLGGDESAGEQQSAAPTTDAKSSDRAVAEIEILRSQNEQLAAEAKELRDAKNKRDAEDYIRDEFGKRKLPLTAERLARLASVMISSGKALVDELIGDIHQPPQGLALAATPGEQPLRGANAQRAAVAAELDEVKREQPKLGEARAHKLAMQRAAKKHPHLFDDTAAA